MDALQMQACRRYSKINHPEAHYLFIEFHGSQTAVLEQVQPTRTIAEEIGCITFASADTSEEKSRLWEARHNACFAALALRPGAQGQPTDVCVPISRLAECINETRLDIERHGLIVPICGHVGDGNFHVLLLVYSDRPDEEAAAATFNDRLIERALRMNGTCTGEHGIGRGKLKYMSKEHGPAVTVMRQLKQAPDPPNILNPGKVIPAASSA
jgi:D-lactate dehydrogenase (cytochrome)